jgi:hypothetical protein
LPASPSLRVRQDDLRWRSLSSCIAVTANKRLLCLADVPHFLLPALSRTTWGMEGPELI